MSCIPRAYDAICDSEPKQDDHSPYRHYGTPGVYKDDPAYAFQLSFFELIQCQQI